MNGERLRSRLGHRADFFFHGPEPASFLFAEIADPADTARRTCFSRLLAKNNDQFNVSRPVVNACAVVSPWRYRYEDRDDPMHSNRSRGAAINIVGRPPCRHSSPEFDGIRSMRPVLSSTHSNYFGNRPGIPAINALTRSEPSDSRGYRFFFSFFFYLLGGI